MLKGLNEDQEKLAELMSWISAMEIRDPDIAYSVNDSYFILHKMIVNKQVELQYIDNPLIKRI